MVVFLDQVGDFPTVKQLLKMEELVEIEPAGDRKESGRWDAFLIEDLE